MISDNRIGILDYDICTEVYNLKELVADLQYCETWDFHG
jgi:hypothetical protein